MTNLEKLQLQQMAMENMLRMSIENMVKMLEENAKILSGLDPYEVEEKLPEIQVEPAEDPFFKGQAIVVNGFEVTITAVGENFLNAIAVINLENGQELRDIQIPRDMALKALQSQNDLLLAEDDARNDEVA